MLVSPISIAQTDTTLLYETGEIRAEGQIYNGKEFGIWTYYYKSGNKMTEVPHVNGYSHGLVKDWYESGELKSETEFEFGGQNGKFTSWYKNGNKLKQGQYHDGQSGEWKFWNEQGEIILISHWKNDYENGLLEYFEDGKRMVEQNWIEGKLHGDVKYFDVNGKLEILRKYIKDTVISEKYFSKTQKVNKNRLETIVSVNDKDTTLPRRVIINGEYNQLNVSYNPTIKSYTGRTYIWVNDTTSIMLGSGELGIRPIDEIRNYDKKNVEISGVLYPFCHAWGDGSQQTIIMPCIRDFREIKVIKD